MEEILKYFPDLTPTQIESFRLMGQLYSEWNEKINVISRKDIENIYLHHILHSLAIARFFTPVPGTSFMDLGTGGGFPGIPLATIWPECKFHLIDRIAKKIKVAESVAKDISLQNVSFQHGDSGECHEKFDFVISRAVMNLSDLIRISSKNVGVKSVNKLPNGLICLKGGDLKNEIETARRSVIRVPLSDWFSESYFATKDLIYVKI